MFLKICILAIIQGAAELLPVSSSAHVIVAEKLMGLDPTMPEMTLLLVMLHTGTMFAVILFFWESWKSAFFSSREVFIQALKNIAAATLLTGIVGLSLKFMIEKLFLRNVQHAEIELIFGNLALISASLACVGLFIIFSWWKSRLPGYGKSKVDVRAGCYIGAVQGICLPFRGFSRSGATISLGLLFKISKIKAEEFSFALAVILTPPVVFREVLRLMHKSPVASTETAFTLFYPSLIGMVLSFVSGWFALKWLSSWLEHDKWHYFGIYCLFFSACVLALHLNGF
jgi:undecaprenyl-diphosphatase